MLLIALSWLYILFTTINLGLATNKLLTLRNTNFVVTAILGLFTTTLLASCWAIFGRIHLEFHLFLLLINSLIAIKSKAAVVQEYTHFINQIKSWSLGFKIFSVSSTFLILAQCASVPYVIDNESYYIQTIKWLNEYGFVKGLVNLHFFLGQVSGWHLTQSAFNFSFLYTNFNDLSGFCLLLGNLFALEKLHMYFKNNAKIFLIVGLLPLANIFFFQFISAPSPDIPVYVFTFVLLFYFFENFKNCTIEGFNLILLLVLFLLYIKNTSLALIVIPLVLFVLHFKLLSKNIFQPFLLSLLVLSLFITKNMIVCGSPVFPSRLWDFTTLDYAIPKQMERFYYNELKLYGYFVTSEQYKSMSAWQLFKQWLSLPKLNGLFNKVSIALLLVCPFFIYKFYNKKVLWTLYSIMVIQLIILFATSPQYRFFMNFILFFSLFCLSCIVFRKSIITFLLYLSLIPTVIILFVPIDLNRFSNYKFMLQISNFSIENSIYPHKNTKYNTNFEKITNGNLIYTSPIDNAFFWGSGDGNLPCVNKVQLAYFETYFFIKPQLRTGQLKDGFYAKKVTPNER
jgi:hypothetical protein